MLQYCALAEVPGFSPAQLEDLTRSIEQKKQKLEDDINAYIRRKQDDLRRYERELLEAYRSMERAPAAASSANSTAAAEPQSHSTETSIDSRKSAPGDTAKRTKHTRVHKREQELCGLVTPIFLPLLDAGTTPTKKLKEKRRSAEEESASGADTPTNLEKDSSSRDAERGKENRRSRSKNREEPMEPEEGSIGSGDSRANQENQKEIHKPEIVKKKRAVVKKSSLRLTSTPRTRRKRVSLVIDDQIVLPADNISEPPLPSPGGTTTSTDSTSNSTASLEDSIDPRLMSPTSPSSHHEHHDPVHHSLSLPTALPSTSPTKHTGHVLSESPPQLEFEPPQTSTRTFLDPSPSEEPVIPQFSPRTPIYASQPDIAEADENDFATYVGGMSGSGVDDVDQVGSYGYPSSLGASYMESYMKSRPLSVRVANAEKAELDEEEKRALFKDDIGTKEELDLDVGRVDEADDDFAIMGGMEGF